MFRIKVTGLDEALEYLQEVSERADKVAAASGGGADAARIKAALGQTRGRVHRSPLMEQEHAEMVAKGEVTEREMYDAYWTIEDIAQYLTED